MRFLNRWIPARIRAFSAQGRIYLGYADSQLRILENEVIRRKLKLGKRIVHLPGGITIKCQVSREFSSADVICPGDKVKKDGKKECFCNRCFAMGKVVRLSKGFEYGTEETRYDVEVCQNKDHYVFYRRVPPSDLANYKNGEKVIVIEGPNSKGYWPECCEKGTCCTARTVTVTHFHHKPMDRWIS